MTIKKKVKKPESAYDRFKKIEWSKWKKKSVGEQIFYLMWKVYKLEKIDEKCTKTTTNENFKKKNIEFAKLPRNFGEIC